MHERNAARGLLMSAAGRARRRMILNRALSEATLAAAVALAGPALFFLAGGHPGLYTLLFISSLLGIGLGAWRLWRSIPGVYQASQVLDLRLGSADQISTAIHFIDSQLPEAVQQRSASAAVTCSLDVKRIFPLTVPRSLWGLGSMVLVVLALYSIRSFWDAPLLSRRPLPQVILQALMPGEAVEEADRSGASAALPAQQDLLFANGDPALDEGAIQPLDEAGSVAQGGGPSDFLEPAQDAGETEGGEVPDDVDMGSDYRDLMDQGSEGAPVPSGSGMPQQSARPSGTDSATPPGSDPGESRRADADNDSARDLLSRLRDAVNNLLSRFQPKQPRTASKRPYAHLPSESGQPGNDGQPDEMGEPQDGGQQIPLPDGRRSASQIAGSESLGSGEKNADEAGPSAPGKEEGDKRIAEARQLAAMGKLTELYGQRAARVTGAVTIETLSDGRKDSQSHESGMQATRSGAEGVLSRDEIPLAYQDYVKDYFDRLRGTAGKQSGN